MALGLVGKILGSDIGVGKGLDVILTSNRADLYTRAYESMTCQHSIFNG